MKIKAVHIIGIIFAAVIIAGGYFFAQMQKPVISGDQFVDYAAGLNLNTTQFKSCFESSKYDSEIRSDLNEGIKLQVSGTPSFYVNGELVASATYTTLKTKIDSVLANESSTNTIKLGSLPPKGNSSARVVVVEFSDYQCPFCRRVEPTVEKIISEYVEKIKFVYMDLPLYSIHKFAGQASNAARCANEQGKFWEYHDVLYDRQDEWALS
ncbi:MAG: thioredoxin domain-containing protein [Candidatus Aenigmatarchaeota archaeon]